MRMLLVGVMLVPLLQSQAAPAGDAQAGLAAWRQKTCYQCHGENGEGGFGPDLAGGRGLTWEQFRKPIYEPWGVMLAYTELQVPEQMIADIYAYVKTLPPATKLGEWYTRRAPPSAPLAQRIFINTAGCGQCHQTELKFGRMWLGEYAKDVNFEYFKKQIYQHTEKRAGRGNMGNFSPDRLPESALLELYKWLEQLGLRASIGGQLVPGERQGANTTYGLTVTNRGVKDKGLAAEGVTIFVRIPKEAKVVGGTGAGYVGVMPLAKLGLEPGLEFNPRPTDPSGYVERPKPDLSGDVAVWKVPRIDASERLTLSLTLAGPPPSPELFKGFDGSTVHWENPGRRPAGIPPQLIYRDLRMPDQGDHERIAVPRMP